MSFSFSNTWNCNHGNYRTHDNVRTCVPLLTHLEIITDATALAKAFATGGAAMGRGRFHGLALSSPACVVIRE